MGRKLCVLCFCWFPLFDSRWWKLHACFDVFFLVRRYSIYQHGKLKKNFKSGLVGDMFVPWRAYWDLKHIVNTPMILIDSASSVFVGSKMSSFVASVIFGGDDLSQIFSRFLTLSNQPADIRTPKQLIYSWKLKGKSCSKTMTWAGCIVGFFGSIINIFYTICARVESRYIGNGHPTFTRESVNCVYKPLLLGWWPSPITGKQWEFRPWHICMHL